MPDTPAPLRVVLTGSESVGKTTLAGDLAAHYGALVVHEYVREFAEQLGRPIVLADVLAIALAQSARQVVLHEQARHRGHRVLVCDTDVLSTVTYAHHYFGACPETVESLAAQHRADLYLLLDIDVPWVPDGVRDRGDRRSEVHQLFVQTLQQFGAPVVRIHGSWQERRALAVSAIDHHLTLRR